MQMMSPELRFRPPMECEGVDALPAVAGWQHEVKLGGYRIQAIRQRGEVHLYSRNGNVFDNKYPIIVDELASIRPKEFILDGEVIAVDESGHHSFNLLQNIGNRKATIQFYMFDVLFLEGKDLTKLPLSRRRQILQREFKQNRDHLRISPILDGELKTIIEKIQEFGFEGIVSKRLDSEYEFGEEPGTWQKKKFQQSSDFVIGGYIPGKHGVDQLIVGEWSGDQLLYVEAVKNGFVPMTRRKVFDAIKGMEIESCPFVNLPEKKGTYRMDREKMSRTKWLEPKLVAEIAFNEKTPSGHLRHSKFLRLRDDARRFKLRKSSGR